jgi:hypothetical protein
MKVFTVDKSKVKDFKGFKKLWDDAKEATPEQEAKVYEILSKIKK